MRSPRAFAAGLILLLGVPLALATAAVFGDGAEDVLHLALAASFFLFAFAVFDFTMPARIKWAAAAAMVALAAIFLLQGVSDLAQSPPLQQLAYGVLGQRLEKLLGYAFLLWCAAMLLVDSEGKTKNLGAVALVAIIGVEIYSFAVAYGGGQPPDALKLLYLPLFLWLLLEGMKPLARKKDAGRAAPA
jgi:hypothetical protein